MTTFLKSIQSKRALTREFQALTSQEVQQYQRKFVQLTDALIAKKQETEQTEQIRKDTVKKQLARMAAELGVSEEDVVNIARETASAKPKGSKAVIRYRYVDEAGKVHEWSGRGRRPLVFQNLIDHDDIEQYRVD
ncbi:H-NS histone family protein [Pseudoalteromonas rubra]|uniref:DNA-binding protein H-NS-like C-terminal domain-containing protein n=1 Tax=Pseudoalteromonas rubra TaxID=43658 RepID=A0A0U2Y7M9_9GAMM|nr:H-NS histone family protein [Pseudoalteromonas rubra]ALU46114.1 hypothetical protein AT705_24440 [Pseudoalteromonas rubra]